MSDPFIDDFTLNYIKFRFTPASDPFVIRWMDCALRPQLQLFQEGTGDGQTEEFSRDAQAMAVAALLPRPIMYSQVIPHDRLSLLERPLATNKWLDFGQFKWVIGSWSIIVHGREAIAAK